MTTGRFAHLLVESPKAPPTEAELDAAEDGALLAEALAGADDTDLGPDAGAAPAANSRELQTSPDLHEAPPLAHEDAPEPDPENSDTTREPPGPETQDAVEPVEPADAQPSDPEPEAPEADEQAEAAPSDHDADHETFEPEAAPSDHDDVAPETRETEASDADEHIEAREPPEPEAAADDTLVTSVAESEPEVDTSQPTDDRGPPAEPGQEDEA